MLFLAVTEPAGAAGITYDCDTAADHFSELVLPAGSGQFTVSGNVQMLAMADSKIFVPLFNIQVAAASSPGKAPASYAGFKLSALPADEKKTPSGAPAIQMLGWSMSGMEDDILPHSLMTKPGTVQSFTMAYDGSTVSVKLGNDEKKFPLVISEPVVRVVCSTGEFLITDLIISEQQ
ncbi:MAG: hypothetical protein KUG65_08405 [Sphingomonadaceae bacterium]|nr:hypothetical protein [Sphingomonadaceae bacterium]